MKPRELIEQILLRDFGCYDDFTVDSMMEVKSEYAKSEAKSFAYWLTMPRKKTNLTMDQLYKEYEETYK